MPKLPDITNMGGRPTPNPANITVGVPVDPSGRVISETGDDLTRMGLVYEEGQKKIQNAQEAVELARLIGTYNEGAVNEWTRLETEDDISSVNTSHNYGKYLGEQKNSLLSGWNGSLENRARLEERLTDLQFQHIGQASGRATAAQRKLVMDNVGSAANKLIVQAYEQPESLPALFNSINVMLDDFSGALKTDEVPSYQRTLRAQVVEAATVSMLARGDFEGAEAALEMPGIDEILGPDVQNRLRTNINTSKNKLRDLQMQAIYEVSADRTKFRSIYGREPTNVELAQMQGIKQEQSGYQKGIEKRDELRGILGREPTEDEFTKYAGVETESGSNFGSGVKGAVLGTITDLAPAYGAELLTPEQERQFEMAVAEYTQPIQYQNPDTGLMETRHPQLPLFARNAIEKRTGQEPDQTETPPPDQPPTEQEGAQSDTQDKTVWGLASKTTGPVPAIIEGASRTPGVGQFVNAPQVTQARNYVPLVQRDLIRVLQNNPRYAEGERKAIESEINIKPELFDNPTAYRNRLIAVDDALSVRERNAFETANSKKVGREERIQAMNILNAIQKFRTNLGVPVRIESEEEWQSLPSGTEYIAPDGKVKRKQ